MVGNVRCARLLVSYSYIQKNGQTLVAQRIDQQQRDQQPVPLLDERQQRRHHVLRLRVRAAGANLDLQQPRIDPHDAHRQSVGDGGHHDAHAGQQGVADAGESPIVLFFRGLLGLGLVGIVHESVVIVNIIVIVEFPRKSGALLLSIRPTTTVRTTQRKGTVPTTSPVGCCCRSSSSRIWNYRKAEMCDPDRTQKLDRELYFPFAREDEVVCVGRMMMIVAGSIHNAAIHHCNYR